MVELLVTTSILAVLGAVLFPVFKSAIDSAKRVNCLTNFRQISAAMMMYEADYDEAVPPVNYEMVDVTGRGNDRTWVQTLLPYVGNFGPFTCPADTGRTDPPTATESPEVVGDPWATYYNASLRSNLGYNYLYFSPLVKYPGTDWRPIPIRNSQISNPANTLAFIDSVYDRTEAGYPYGGGSWVVVPPCRYLRGSRNTADTFRLEGTVAYFGFQPVGWHPESSLSWLVYGGAWPWHKGKFTVAFADGHVKGVSLGQLIDGCDFLPEWRGPITSLEDYIWDITR
ncbi:MAG: hypothetical protein AKCLJLPJ_00927 [Fimbriimonadales bacterium]|nr:DUF1559 domain-containing protein [Armatimonadota bacterium]MBV6502871.1 hypothetical protein [Fimbriimonadales bacterium]NOG93677.1 DUF1559 domain-containing protein [Armatimonadota bacterium]